MSTSKLYGHVLTSMYYVYNGNDKFRGYNNRYIHVLKHDMNGCGFRDCVREGVCAKVTGKQNSTLTVLVCVNDCVLLPLFRYVYEINCKYV